MRIFIPITACLFLLSCGSSEQAELKIIREQEESTNSQERIAKLEAIVYSDTATVLNVAIAIELAGLYNKAVKEDPTDSTGADLLFKAGELYMNAGHGNKAIKSFQQVHARFPSNERAPVARFLKGFVAETVLEEDALAKRFYQEFITAHPDHKLASDAQMSIELLGLSDAELMKRIKGGQES